MGVWWLSVKGWKRWYFYFWKVNLMFISINMCYNFLIFIMVLSFGNVNGITDLSRSINPTPLDVIISIYFHTYNSYLSYSKVDICYYILCCLCRYCNGLLKQYKILQTKTLCLLWWNLKTSFLDMGKSINTFLDLEILLHKRIINYYCWYIICVI